MLPPPRRVCSRPRRVCSGIGLSILLSMKQLLLLCCALVCSLSVYSESGTTGDCTWTFSAGTLTISGSGATGDVTWTEHIPEIQTIWINASVTGVSFTTGNKYTKLTSVHIADGNTELGIAKDAFRGTHLTSVHLGRDLSYNPYSGFLPSYGYYGPFQGITTLTTLTIGRSVTSIGDYCFDGCSSLSEVNFPFNFETIGQYAFRNCTALKELQTKDHLTSIGNYAFSGCTSLSKLTLSSGVQYIGIYSFKDCPLRRVDLPSSVKELWRFCDKLDELHIDDAADTLCVHGSPYVKELYLGRYYYAWPTDDGPYQNGFSGMDSLKRVVISDSVKTIPHEAFSACQNLEQVTQGCNVSSIGSWAFAYTKFTRYISFAPVPPQANNAFYKVNLAEDTLYVPFNSRNLYKTTAPWKDFGTILDVEMLTPDKAGYWSNGNWRYSNRSHTLYVHVEGEVDSTMIGDISRPINAIPVDSIYFIELDEGVTHIADWCFYQFTALKGIRIPSTVTEIGEGAFCRCTNLIDIVLPPNLEKLNSYTFYECLSLPAINIPASVKSIGDYVFTYCDVLERFDVDRSSPYFASESDVLFNKDKTVLICYPAQRAGLNYDIPTSVQEIRTTAFCRANNLATVTVPPSVTHIAVQSFLYCDILGSVSISEDNEAYRDIYGVVYDKGLTCMVWYPSGKQDNAYTVPKGVTLLSNGAMAGNKHLKSVTLPSTLESIGSYAFDECHKLSDVYVLAPKIPMTQSYVFNEVPLSNATLHVPSQLVDSYSAQSPWSMFGNIIPLTGGETGLEMLQNADNVRVTHSYTIDGRPANPNTKGLHIQRMSNGAVRKVYVP